jgi:nucleoside 2-deoxyribosyltransferase
MQGKYKVITLCGSTRFKEEFLQIQKQLTLKGNIVLSVGVFSHSGDSDAFEGMSEDHVNKTKMMLDDMHKRKIDMADEIFVINVDGYIGDSTASEMAYATQTGKPIRFYNNPDAWIDDIGGYHDGEHSWNPNSIYCGECSKKTCKGCERATLN